MEDSQAEYRNHPQKYQNRKIELVASNLFDIDCKEINLYTYWQGLVYAKKTSDIKYLLVAQDWGNPSTMSEGFKERIKKINQGDTDTKYLDDSDSKIYETDKNLVRLFNCLGYEAIDKIRYDDLFFTNFCLGYRNGSDSGGMSANLMKGRCDEKKGYIGFTFFRELVTILEPEKILCLGKLTFQSVYRALTDENASSLENWKKGYNYFIGNHKKIIVAIGGRHIKLYPLAHCGSMGTMNHNRGTGHKANCLKNQENDWRRIIE